MTASAALRIVDEAPEEMSPAATAETAPTPAPQTVLAKVAAKYTLPAPRALWDAAWPPVTGIAVFIGLWALLAPNVQTSLGALPGPGDVWTQFLALMSEHAAARDEAAKIVAAGGTWSGAPTFIDQIFTSLKTVALGFILATVVAVPLGLVAGMSRRVNAALNPIIQVMRPISPLAWLPIVTMVVSAAITSADPLFAKSFVISAVTVTLCSLWQTLINTSVGVASIDKDLLNVGRVLRLSWFAKLTKLVLPSAVPYIFTGMRLSLGVGWMVLIAAEMLSQNPGLGKFVWDEFQSGSERSLARIMVAVVAIGLIGFALDKIMGALQHHASKRMGR
jgi:nitrate/nitrite transport system permease protein